MDPEQVTKIFDVQVSAGNRKACCICAYSMSNLIHCTVVLAFRGRQEAYSERTYDSLLDPGYDTSS